ncbi:hypothetical protein [Actinoplanes subglobosus]|uniref:Uncharacterized protein n=1 Tax=Actinoplanes subglobosus TaxID=1547892 RepID=A0ABV8IR76_9ACTN
MIDITEYFSEAAAIAPWAAAATGSFVARVRRSGESSELATLTALTTQVAAAGLGGQVTYRTRDGAEWAVTLGSPTKAPLS